MSKKGFTLERLLNLEQSIAFLSNLKSPAGCSDNKHVDVLLIELSLINSRRESILKEIGKEYEKSKEASQ